MMMQALHAGGMKIAFSPSENTEAEQRHQRTGYDANPGGRFEVARGLIDPYNFPKTLQGAAVKCLCWPHTPFGWGLFRYPPFEALTTRPDMTFDYRVVWLHRPAAARWASWRKSSEELLFNHVPVTQELQAFRDACANLVLGVLKDKPERLLEWDYDAIIDDPRPVFDALVGKGWPIDPQKAAAVVNPKWRRFSSSPRAGLTAAL